MKLIQLSQKRVALVDDQDFELVNQFKWTLHSQGYAYRFDKDRNCILMHRFITSAPKTNDVDHKNKNKLDNRRENLRICTTSQNLMGKGKQKNNTSGIVGVNFHKQTSKWRAYIWINGKQKYLGLFADKRLAKKVRDEASKKYFGEFAYEQ